MFAANPHLEMLLSGIFGTDWVAKAVKALYVLYAKYANVLIEKRTLVEESKIFMW